MRQSIFDSVGNLDTLIAVVIGAVLATSGALFAELIQERLNRKRRQRDAARFFGEILSSIDRVLDFAFRSQSIGDQWGPVTMRLFKTALREAGVYERNRERLFDIKDMELRTSIHSHFLVETFPIEAVIEYCQEVDQLEQALNDEIPPSPARAEQMKARLVELRAAQNQALTSLRSEHAKTGQICAHLEKLAGVAFNQAENRPGQIPQAGDPPGTARSPSTPPA